MIETYQGVIDEELMTALKNGVHHDLWINSRTAMKSEADIQQMIYPDVTDDRIFGALSRLNISDFMDQDKILRFRELITENQPAGLYFIQVYNRDRGTHHARYALQVNYQK